MIDDERRKRPQKWRYALGLVATVVWIVFCVLAAWGDVVAAGITKTGAALTLNEWGDFIAGTVAPVAFFWLILGYMQQGDELAMNTAALRTYP